MPRKGPKKNVPIMSHEWVIQNHGDIASCGMIVFLVLYMIQTTQPIVAKFVTLNYNVTNESAARPNEVVMSDYYAGYRDIFNVFFYTLLAIVMHAIIQEYLIDKYVRRLHLSKAKTDKFTDSVQLFFWYLTSFGAGMYLMVTNEYDKDVKELWTGYPHSPMNLFTKCYFIAQFSHWLHWLPELYFQKIKKEDWNEKIIISFMNITVIGCFYWFSFAKLFIVLNTVHCLGEILFHFARVLHYSSSQIDASATASYLFTFWKFFYPLIRAITCGFGAFILLTRMPLQRGPSDDDEVHVRNYNTPQIRMALLTIGVLVTCWMMRRYLLFVFRHKKAAAPSYAVPPSPAKSKQKKKRE